tara:strand:- start:4812 stop:5354 length:543 start_codon:yes stop_codon:yes gene_type:complete
MYSKIQVNTANAIVVLASDTVPIPDPNSFTVSSATGDASTQDKFSDANQTFLTSVNVGAIIYDSTDVRAYRVTAVDSDTVLSVTPSIVGASGTVTYKIYNKPTEGCVLWVGSDVDVKQDVSGQAAGLTDPRFVDMEVVTVGNNTVKFENSKLGEYLPVQILQLKEAGTTQECRDKCIALS